MKRLSVVFFSLLFLCGCDKHVTVPATYEYNLFTLDFTASDSNHADDSVNNHISSLQFTNVGRSPQNDGQYLGISFFHEWKPAKVKYAFKFTYMQDVPLIGACSGGGSDSLGNYYRYTFNSALDGKLLFKVRDTITGLLSYKLYVDPYASIELRYNGDPDSVTPEALAAAFNHHLRGMRKESQAYFIDNNN